MADSVLVNISDMIDLAIGTPEVGIVDFNMLQTVLHCLAQQMRILGKNVELRGSMTALPAARDNVQTITISEYAVDAEDQARTPATQAEQDTILVVERVKKTDSQFQPVRGTASQKSAGPPARPAAKGAAGTRDAPSGGERLNLVTLSKFNLLEGTVEDLRSRVYGSMPKNEAILEEVRSQTNLRAITDMWTSLNVSSRLEAAEAGIGKLSSLVQDLIADTVGLQDVLRRRASKPDELPVLKAASAPAAILPLPPAPGQGAALALGGPAAGPLQDHVTRLRNDLDALTNTFYNTVEQLQGGKPLQLPPPPARGGPVITEVEDTDQRPPQTPRTHGLSVSGASAPLLERINDLDRRLQKCCETVGKSDGVISDQLNSFQDQLEYLMKQVAALTKDMTSGKLSPDLVRDLQGLMQLFQTVQDMQGQLKEVHDTALQLAAEKEDRQHHINALLEQIELLKTIKMDREDMYEAMADKADLRLVARKVSQDQFELTCDDLSKGLEQALGKLQNQEALWQQALDDIQREIETKLDKFELSPVKDFFNIKLKQLQDNLKQMADLRREAEAAGTKRKLLRDVNCISCDAKAVMPMENAVSTNSRGLPASLSMKPYLSYELDTIRKQQAAGSCVPQRNMHDWETIEKTAPKQPTKARSESGKHLCNRYCGGSHTVTTPAQRVARLGHFMKQWGPDVLPLSSGLAAGDDGRMYKVNTVEGASAGPGGAVDNAVCTPQSENRKSGDAKAPQRPSFVNEECRCLEGRT